MPTITITEKLWDGVRPSSVKKTGLSEAIRAFAKIKKTPNTAKEFDDLIAAVGVLGKAIASAGTVVGKAKDDKKGAAAAKLKAWKTECDKAEAELEKDKYQLGLMKASKEADEKLKELAQRVEDSIKSAQQLTRDVSAGKLKDNKKIAQDLQDLRSTMRDALKATQKDGFCEYIRTYPAVLEYKIKPADVPLPPNVKAIKGRLPTLETEAQKARIEAEKVLAVGAQSRAGTGADLAKPIVAEYKKVGAKLKNWIAPSKKFATDVKALSDKCKELLGKGVPYDKILPYVKTTHEKIMKLDETAVAECARGRIARGDIQAKVLKIRESLAGDDLTRDDFNGIIKEEWNLIMVIYREVSENIAVAHRQVDRVLRLVGESSKAAKVAADKMAQDCDQECKDLVNKFLK